MPRVAPNNSAPATPEHLLEVAVAGLRPSFGAENRVRTMLRCRMQSSERVPAILRATRDAVVPPATLAGRVWSLIAQSIAPVRSLSAWDRVRGILSPAETLSAYIWRQISPRLEPALVPAFASRKFKWGAAIAVVIVTARLSPLLFLAPPTIAESPVTLLSTRGTAEVLSGALWQPIRGEITLTRQTSIQTQGGEATIILHDDAVFRLAPYTRVTLYDLSDRPERGSDDATIALEQGRLWVLGLVPKNVRGVTVVTPQGRVVLHEGSASIVEGADVSVMAWDRSASVYRRGKQTNLFTGQYVVLGRDGSQALGKHDHAAFQNEWTALNLGRDAAHRRDIAQSQQERRAASAGILPGTPFYSMKRLAEEMDVLLTFGEEQKVKKRITQANTRLNEAAALLNDKREDIQVQAALREYKTTLLQVASGSGGSTAVQHILQEEVMEGVPATLAAALPGDSAYTLKQTVQETIAALPESLSKPDVHAEAIIDELVAVKEQAELGDTTVARQKLAGITSSIAALGTGASVALSADALQEVEAIAMHVTAVVDAGNDDTSAVDEEPAVEPRTPAQPRHAARLLVPRAMSQEQVTAKAQEIRGRIFAFNTKKAQQSVLKDLLHSIEQNPDRGRILRELAEVLPRNGLAQRVEMEIRTLNAAVEEQMTASGGLK